MDTGATEEQQALLEVSTRFMEDACPLRAVRDGTWRDGAVMATYRRQAADLGWYSMLVPESLGGGSVSDNGLLDAALIAYGRGARLQPGSFVGTNVVAVALALAGSDASGRLVDATEALARACVAACLPDDRPDCRDNAAALLRAA